MSELLQPLIVSLDDRLHSMRYAKRTISGYHFWWRCLSEFMEAEAIHEINRDVCESFFHKTFGLTLNEPPGTYTPEGRHCHRAIIVLLEYQNNGTIPGRRESKEHTFSEVFQPAIGEFMSFVNSSLARTSHRQIRFRMESFLGFLEKHGCTDFMTLNRQTILDYCKSRSYLSRKTQSYDAYTLRKFFDFLYRQGYTTVDNSVFVPNVTGNNKGQIPSFYTKEELTKLLSSVDRESPIGKRDYAILLIAVRYGMRVGDIRNLKLSDIDWNSSSFSFLQEKNGKLMTFPLLDDVATAFVDYFQNGRPQTDCRSIFVRHVAPYEAFGKDDNLHYIINKYMRFCGFNDFNHRKHGLHSLRHSIAGNMLDQGVPMPTISEILGHSSTDTTMIYTKIDIKQLRSCALEVD